MSQRRCGELPPVLWQPGGHCCRTRRSGTATRRMATWGHRALAAWAILVAVMSPARAASSPRSRTAAFCARAARTAASARRGTTAPPTAPAARGPRWPACRRRRTSSRSARPIRAPTAIRSARAAVTAGAARTTERAWSVCPGGHTSRVARSVTPPPTIALRGTSVAGLRRQDRALLSLLRQRRQQARRRLWRTGLPDLPERLRSAIRPISPCAIRRSRRATPSATATTAAPPSSAATSRTPPGNRVRLQGHGSGRRHCGLFNSCIPGFRCVGLGASRRHLREDLPGRRNGLRARHLHAIGRRRRRSAIARLDASAGLKVGYVPSALSGNSPATLPRFAFLTPRTLPPAAKLEGRVAVLDIAFASEGGGASFDKTTLPFIKGLGSRLAAWVDHHDHERHVDYAGDPRFVLATKAEHGACPEMVTPEVVRAAGPVDTVAMHLDLDGLYSGAKWVLGGVEPYDGRRRRRARGRHAPRRARPDRDAHRSGAARALSRRDAEAPGGPVPGGAHEGARAVGGDRARRPA